MGIDIRPLAVIEGTTVHIDGNMITVKGPNGELKREFPKRVLNITSKDNQIIVSSKETNAKTKALIGAFKSHIKNMMAGAKEDFAYKLKICSTHFPMTVKVSGNELHVSNLFGGKKTLKFKMPPTVKSEVKGDILKISSPNIELAGNFAGAIEKGVRPRRKDRRIFQDGIYLIEKAGKPIR